MHYGQKSLLTRGQEQAPQEKHQVEKLDYVQAFPVLGQITALKAWLNISTTMSKDKSSNILPNKVMGIK